MTLSGLGACDADCAMPVEATVKLILPKGFFAVVVVAAVLFCDVYSGKDGIANLGLLDTDCDMGFPLVGTRLMLAKAPPVLPLDDDDVGLYFDFSITTTTRQRFLFFVM